MYLHMNRTIDYKEWAGPRNEPPNTLENNSLNPFQGTKNEEIWKNTPHRECNDNDDSESIDLPPIQPNNSSRIVVKISIDKNEATIAGSKRGYGGRGNDFDDMEMGKPSKRSKH